MTRAEKTKNADKRERILAGALKAFAKKGFYNTRVSEIASEAGVADGTIYLYFKNKDDLLISLFEDRMEWLIDRMQTELSKIDDSDAFGKLRKVVDLHVHLSSEDPDLAEFITVELRQSAKFVKEYKNPKFHDYLNVLDGIIASGQTAGTIRKDVDSRLVSRAIFGALDEVLLINTLSQNAPSEADNHATQIADILVSGLRATPTEETT